jgi:hypothetical protein
LTSLRIRIALAGRVKPNAHPRRREPDAILQRLAAPLVRDLPAREGHAIHGGKAKSDRTDALKIATLLRGGMLPQAYAYPAGRRA